ncbi:MAG TPA: hypothetical protein VEB19_11050 [Gemmatimonadaceae bacterium]|nr:hypothetical protein [Gemmatimonadaceae bacterium]
MRNPDRNPGTDGRMERAKDNALGKHDDNPGVADHIGEAAGGISGVTAGAAAGSVVGPVGTVIGGIVGAMAGWWTGRAVAEAATSLTTEDEDYYRKHYTSSPNRLADRSYDEVKPAYYLGHVASRNPEYANRQFDEIEPELQRGWSSNPKHGSWDSVRGFASEGYTRGRSTIGVRDHRLAGAADKRL